MIKAPLPVAMGLRMVMKPARWLLDEVASRQTRVRYVIFRVTPYHRNIARTLLKSPKFYFYDTGQVLGDEGVRLENVTACALLKEIQFREDCFGDALRLHYLRTKDGREIDFLVTEEGEGKMMIEVKWADGSRSRGFSLFEQYFPETEKIQIVKQLEREKTFPDGVEIRQAHSWLSTFSFSSKTAMP